MSPSVYVRACLSTQQIPQIHKQPQVLSQGIFINRAMAACFG